MGTSSADYGGRRRGNLGRGGNISEPNNEKTGTGYAQGDVLLLRVADAKPGDGVSQQGPVILAEGEHTGHRHAFYGGALMFRDDAMARDVPSQLYRSCRDRQRRRRA